MPVTAVSAISAYSQDPPLRQQNGLRQDLMTLQKALSAGNLNTAQRALNRFQQDLQGLRPQQNGVRASASVNPQSTMRSDLQALQSALDSGDLAMAEEAFGRIQQDSHQASRLQRRSASAANQPRSALPKQQEDPPNGLGLSASAEKSNGGLIDVTA